MLQMFHFVSLKILTFRYESVFSNSPIKEELFKPKKRKQNQVHREWRERKECYGEMEQFDDGYHHWFEDRGKEICLLASIDDATGKITKLKFAQNEGVIEVFRFWKEYLESKNKPVAIYLDKFSTYKVNHKNATDNHELITQFQRACQDLNINLITAHSPQAKGRVERLFETLQDRLVKELRLQNISDTETVNQFLEEKYISDFNDRFSVLPAKDTDLHRPLTEHDQKNLDKIFSIQSRRQVKNDFTIQFKNQWYQLEEIQPTTVYRKDEVLIEDRLDRSIHLGKKEKYLNFKKLPARPKKIKTNLVAITPRKSTWIPPVNHPWRKQIHADIQYAIISKVP
ncbi:MAG: Integrase family protein [Parcubacteria group bacterium GW2011_GWC2_45_7]|nr:MAG: Integrase family protein [Parcubacteria group bacterium GW2011_GWC2_45_7]